MNKTMKWEYLVVPIRTRISSSSFDGGGKPILENVQNDLNSLGGEGWELVSIQDITLKDDRMFTVAYLKRRSES